MRMVRFTHLAQNDELLPVWINADAVSAVIAPSVRPPPFGELKPVNRTGKPTSLIFVGPGKEDFWKVLGELEDVIQQLTGDSGG